MQAISIFIEYLKSGSLYCQATSLHISCSFILLLSEINAELGQVRLPCCAVYMPQVLHQLHLSHLSLTPPTPSPCSHKAHAICRYCKVFSFFFLC